MLLPLQGVLASPTHKPRVPLRSALGYALLGFQPVFDKEFSSVFNKESSQRIPSLGLQFKFVVVSRDKHLA